MAKVRVAFNGMGRIGKNVMRVIVEQFNDQIEIVAGNDLVSQAQEFFKFTKFNGSILTKVDADVKGGGILSILSESSKPIIYIGTGQEYKDLEKFNEERFLSGLFQ